MCTNEQAHSQSPTATHRFRTIPEVLCPLVRIYYRWRHHWATGTHLATLHNAILATHITPTRWRTEEKLNPMKRPAQDQVGKTTTLGKNAVFNDPFDATVDSRTKRGKSNYPEQLQYRRQIRRFLARLSQRFPYPHAQKRKQGQSGNTHGWREMNTIPKTTPNPRPTWV